MGSVSTMEVDLVIRVKYLVVGKFQFFFDEAIWHPASFEGVPPIKVVV